MFVHTTSFSFHVPSDGLGGHRRRHRVFCRPDRGAWRSSSCFRRCAPSLLSCSLRDTDDLSTSEAAQEMSMEGSGSSATYHFEVALGANSWEQFYIIQDHDQEKQIYPAYANSSKDQPCVGPHHGSNRWLLDGRDQDGVPSDDIGEPGTRLDLSTVTRERSFDGWKLEN